VKKGFTLIELLIVVAIIAILAAIAVPNFLEAQTRAKVARVKNDQRSLATAIETYYLDNNTYPLAWRTSQRAEAEKNVVSDSVFSNNVNSTLVAASGGPTTNYAGLWSFVQRTNTGQGQVAMLTTPISYITSYFPDPFMDAKASSFAYFRDTNGWIVWSPGPDGDINSLTDLGPGATVESMYNSSFAQPSSTLLANGTNTYDSTNGTVSNGDVWRVKQ